VGQKSKTQIFVHVLAKYSPLIFKFFINKFCEKFVIKLLLNIPSLHSLASHLNYVGVTTLPCEQ